MKSSIERLPNGLTLVLKENKLSPVVAFQFWLGVGSADERPHEAGLAHVMEHMLFKGTKRRGVGEIPRDVERAGGYINAWTSHDETVFHVTMASRFAEQGLDILSDAIQNAALNADELSKELQVILEEIRMGADNPNRVSTEQLFKTIFRKHPYGRPVIGYQDVVKSFNRRIVKNFYDRWYIPENTVLVVVGDFDIGQMRRLINTSLGKWSGRKLPRRVNRLPEPRQRGMRISHYVRPFSEATLAIGFPVPGLTHEDVPALDLLAAVLGQGASSRLETVIMRKMGLGTDMRSISFTPKDIGVFCVFVTVPPHNLTEITRAVSEQIFRLTKEPISPGEIEKARSLLLSDTVYSEETVDGIARKLGYYGLHAGDTAFERNYFAALTTIDSDTLFEVAQKYLLSSAATITVVVPDPSHRTYDHPVKWITKSKKAPVVKGDIFKSEILNAMRQGAQSKAVISRKKSKYNEASVVKLSSGDTLIVKPDPNSKIVAVRASFFGGLRSESVKNNGLSVLLSRCFTRGTTKRSAMDVALKMDQLACSVGGSTGRNTIGISGQFMARNFSEGFELMSECLRHPALLKDEVAREKELLIDEIRANEDSPDSQVIELFQQTLFGKHPYGRSILGTEKTVSSLTAATMRNHLKSVTQPGKMILAMVGGLDPNEAVELAEKFILPDTLKGEKIISPLLWKPRKGPLQIKQSLQKEQSHIVIGFPGVTLDNDERFILELVTEILGGHGGRLFEAVREKRGLAYSVTAFSMEGMEPGYLAAYVGTSPGNEKLAIDAILSEIEILKHKKPTMDEVKRVKRYLLGTRAIARQRVAAIATSTSLGYLYGLGYDIDDQYPSKIRGITAGQISDAVSKFFVLDKMVVACVGPNAEKLDLL